ncbi:MAG: lipopolysaccharide assembly protein LapA domain-containing protein [Alphaproteobacteria bacterium]
MRIFSGLFGLIFLAIALCFALANRQNALLSLWPFGVELEVPLYLLTLGTLFLGLLFGSVIAWLAMLPYRMQNRRLRKDITALHVKIEDLQQTVIAPSASRASGVSKKSFWRLGA